MIMTISWIQFQQHYMKTDQLIFVVEESNNWCLYASQGMIIVKCVVNKSESAEENYAFVDRHLNNMNVVKAEYVIEQKPIKLKVE